MVWEWLGMFWDRILIFLLGVDEWVVVRRVELGENERRVQEELVESVRESESVRA